jgi:hypothetical protein
VITAQELLEMVFAVLEHYGVVAAFGVIAVVEMVITGIQIVKGLRK